MPSSSVYIYERIDEGGFFMSNKLLLTFALIGTSFLSFLITLIAGNIVARVIYEGILITVMLWKNTTEIKNSLKK